MAGNKCSCQGFEGDREGYFVIGSFSCFATRGLGGQGFKGLE